MASIDFFTVPTATFRVLFVFIVLSRARRHAVHFGVTEHPNQEWTTQQIREAFPWDQAPKYLLRDRDSIYGKDFAAITTGMGIEEVITAPRSPWQNPYVERLVAPSGESAWTTPSCGTRDRCAGLCEVILPTLIRPIEVCLASRQKTTEIQAVQLLQGRYLAQRTGHRGYAGRCVPSVSHDSGKSWKLGITTGWFYARVSALSSVSAVPLSLNNGHRNCPKKVP
jgi:transposase InsO family protein